MKRIFSYIILVLLFASCKKDEIKSVYTLPTGTPSFTSSVTTAVLDSTKREETAVAFSWGTVNYGINADVTYSLEFDTSTAMSRAIVFIMNADTSHAYTVAALNAIALQAGLEGDKAGALYVRMKAEVRQNGTNTNPSSIPATYSALLTLTVTPYAPGNVARMWVPGEYQGWNAATAPTIADAGGKGAYEGYIYFPANANGNYTFKITTAPNWNDPAWGYESATKMVKGGGDLYVPAAGYYLVKANVNSRDWSTTATTWSLVGDGVADNWETDIPMTYDVESGTWIAQSVMIKGAGSFKFRANNAWTINYGPTDGKLVQDGGNISAPGGVAGNYKVVLNLSESGNYTYTLTKL
ncbi:SusE domain-containing protein [Chitinophaga rhizophila]|uniref:SusE domain-containing protein n=1 Tax=Chitinophaga rhizophila TaxID=2866212 RepID=A0ABS7GAW2_9BACT|nr:SusE domain-containing protein [Chitinophaga rhizophila]MBW8684807.1 SusE domain-containing protein [Chitinophaga rhizophila]